MQYDIAFILISGFITLALLLLRTNVALSIMGLCAGYVFSDIFSSRLAGFLYDNNYTAGSLPLASLVSIALIIAPAALIVLRFRHYQKGRYIQHIIPAVAFVALLAVLVLNNLPLSYEDKLVDESYLFMVTNKYELIIIASVIILAVLDIMIFEFERKQRDKRLKKRAKKKHK